MSGVAWLEGTVGREPKLDPVGVAEFAREPLAAVAGVPGWSLKALLEVAKIPSGPQLCRVPVWQRNGAVLAGG